MYRNCLRMLYFKSCIRTSSHRSRLHWVTSYVQLELSIRMSELLNNCRILSNSQWSGSFGGICNINRCIVITSLKHKIIIVHELSQGLRNGR